MPLTLVALLVCYELHDNFMKFIKGIVYTHLVPFDFVMVLHNQPCYGVLLG